MEGTRKVTVAEAARMLGKSSIFVREGIKRGVLPIGTAMQMPGSTKWSFHISPGKLEAYLKGEDA